MYENVTNQWQSKVFKKNKKSSFLKINSAKAIKKSAAIRADLHHLLEEISSESSICGGGEFCRRKRDQKAFRWYFYSNTWHSLSYSQFLIIKSQMYLFALIKSYQIESYKYRKCKIKKVTLLKWFNEQEKVYQILK